jgi:SAM-dependent methyltransferase
VFGVSHPRPGAGASRAVPRAARWGYRDATVVVRYHSRRYTRLGGRLRAFFVARAVRRALDLAGVGDGVVLDLPCGSGVVVRALARRGVRCVAADLSLQMLRFARARSGERLPVACVDIECPPFRAGAVAAVVSLRFFAHLPLDRWAAVLRGLAALTSGPVVIGLPMRRSSKHRWRAFKRSIGVEAKQRPIFSTAQLRRVLSEGGLTLCGRVWQSPFTDTGLVIAAPVGVARATSGEPAGPGLARHTHTIRHDRLGNDHETEGDQENGGVSAVIGENPGAQRRQGGRQLTDHVDGGHPLGELAVEPELEDEVRGRHTEAALSGPDEGEYQTNRG